MEVVMTEARKARVGDPAPDFTLKDQTGVDVTLSSFRGKKHVALIFHPLAFTSICNVQMPGYSKERQTFDGLNAQVLGISVDSVPAHRAWAELLGGIDYPMLADFYPHGAVSEKYGVLRPDGVSERATLVIDRDGIIRHFEIHEMGVVPDQAKLVAVLRSLG